MTRERGYLQVRMRLGYSADVINAVKALRKSPDVPVEDDRVALFGRSMGGGVILKALVAEPGLVQAASPWASVSSLERENYNHFIRPDPDDSGLREQLARRHRNSPRAQAGGREIPAGVVRRRACLRTGVQRCDGPHGPVLRPPAGLSHRSAHDV